MKKVNMNKVSVIPWAFIAAVLSWSVNKSVFWCIFHMLLGGVYTIYWICTYSRIPEWIMKNLGV